MDERISFIGSQTPKEVRYLCKNLKSISLEDFEKLVHGSITTIRNPSSDNGEFLQLTQDMDQDIIQKFYPGINMLIQKALRQSSKQLPKPKFVGDLKDLGIEGKFQNVLAKALFGEDRELLKENVKLTLPHLPVVSDFRWRVDVGISTTTLNRSLEPSILFDLSTSKGENHTFEVSKEKFHVLRHTVAEVLSNVQQLEKRSVFKMEV